MPSCAKLQACLQQLKHYWPGRCAATCSDDLPLLEDRNVSQCITMSYNVEMCRCWIWTVRRARFWVTAGGAKCPALRVSTKVDDWFVVFSGLLNINLRMIIDIMYIYMYIYIHMYILLKFDFLLFLELTFLNGTTVKCCPNFDLWFLPKISEEIEEACQSHPVY